MKKLAVDLHYLPNLEYFAAIAGADEVLVFPEDIYQRQSYLNRTQIRLANKVETLSVPVQGRRPKIPMEEILIDYSQKWESIHLRGIQSAYGKAPYFEYFFPYFESALIKSHIDLTEVEDIRAQIVPKSSFSSRSYYTPVIYSQLFGLDFEPNLSVVDLLFCEGPAAKNIILNSVKKQWTIIKRIVFLKQIR